MALRLLLLLVSLLCTQAALLAIDYGSEWVKASVVAPGRSPISIVLNEARPRWRPAGGTSCGL
jgi:hypoxia up-regulated 1